MKEFNKNKEKLKSLSEDSTVRMLFLYFVIIMLITVFISPNLSVAILLLHNTYLIYKNVMMKEENNESANK